MSGNSGAGLRAVCVFCGSSTGIRPSYAQAATDLGNLLAAEGIDVVYGGAHVGLMGAVADAALAAGGRVTGVIPASLIEREIAHTGLSELVVVDTMRERKQQMAARADAFIALPGGFGTLEELFEVVTATQVGVHHKPVGLLDVEDYFDDLARFLDHAVREEMLSPDNRAIVLRSSDPTELLGQLRSWRPRHTAKWIAPPVP